MSEQIGGEWTALREALGEVFELIESGELVRDCSRDGEPDWLQRAAKLTLTLKKAQEALAAAAPAPPAKFNEIEIFELLKGRFAVQGMQTNGVAWLTEQLNKLMEVKRKDVAPPAQDGQGAELLGPPRGGSSSDLAEPNSEGVGSFLHSPEAEEGFRRALASPAEVWYPCGATASEGAPLRDCPIHGRECAKMRSKAAREVASAAMEYDTECPACDGKYQCTLDRNHVGPHKAHGFDRVLREWTPPTPSPTEGASCDAANTGVVQKEVGEGLREALQKWQRKYFSAGISHEMWPKAVEHAFEAGWTAALAAPAPKPAPPALEAKLKEFWDREYREQEMPPPAEPRCTCLERADGIGSMHGIHDSLCPVRRAAERKPPR